MNAEDGPTPAEDDAFFARAELQQPFGPPVPICWSAQTSENQQLHLQDLSLWVEWLARHYRLDRRHIPACWREHWELIEELAALHLAWEGAYSTSAHADGPLAWHEHFDATRGRLADWVSRSGCRPGEHRGNG